MSNRYKFHNPNGIFFITFTVEKWTDVFTRNEYKDILLDNLKYCQKNKGLEIYAWCIMTNHIHMIVSSQSNLLSNIVRDYKKFTSKAIIQAIKENIQESRREALLKQFITSQGIRFWQKSNKPIELWSSKVIQEKLHYIHQNPVKAGIVFNPEDYVYSSAYDYAGGKGLLNIILIE